MKPITRHVLATTAVLGVGATLVLTVFVWSGAYDFAADEPHADAVTALITTMRDRSIDRRAAALQPPDLSDPARIVQGAGNYHAMCAGCHLAPGMGETELSRGLYPKPPDLSKERVDLATAFWTIKHGIKASAMPAWGKSMSDEYLWNMAAFVQALPKLDRTGYDDLVARSGGHHHDHGSAHDDDDDHDTHGPAHAAPMRGKDPHAHTEAVVPPAVAGSASQPDDDATRKPAGSTHTHADGKPHIHAPQGAKP